MREFFERFRYRLGELDDPRSYVERYGENYEFVLKDETHRRYYVGNNKVIYHLIGKGELYLYYGETFNYETIIVDGDYTIYSLIQPERFAYIFRDIHVRGKVVVRTIGIGGYIESTNNLYLYRGSNGDDRGIGFVRDDQVSVYTSNLNHLEPSSSSYSHYRGVANHNSNIRLNGFINISKDAQDSNSFLDQHVILLKDTANAFSFPALKIENNSVRASHSATISKIPEEMLFYLETRGISREESIGMLIGGFVSKVMDIDDTTERIIRSYISLS
ncbi:MAG: SufD family Fe-S cluster assembly protein [Candidatus Micrarchaeota archaeon]|nr:SufD family Fe-S cluster assembly protein [Candidatus Micrarchaeota archaeon]MCX8154402.1 SufD family Fe-S cluster assembly protein [Candidatus Micrarchaeota archaeon]